MKPLSPNSLRLSAGVFLVVLAIGGCTGNSSDQATVTGRVLYDNEPLPSGTVTFLFADGTKKGTSIGSDGSYRMTEIGPGPVRIGVLSKARVPPGLQVPGAPGGNTGPPPEPVVQIPSAYNSPVDSGLSYEVHKGAQEHNIELSRKPPDH